jgi:hypothetical protein
MIAIGHTPARFKHAGVGTKGILECKCLSKNADCAVVHAVATVIQRFVSAGGMNVPNVAPLIRDDRGEDDEQRPVCDGVCPSRTS